MNSFDPTIWQKVTGANYSPVEGRQLILMASEPMVVWVKLGKSEAVAAVGLEARLKLVEGCEFKVTCAGTVYRQDRTQERKDPTGEVYTNVDRMPHQSGNLDAVSRQIRQMRLEQKQFMERIQREEGEPVTGSNHEEADAPENTDEGGPGDVVEGAESGASESDKRDADKPSKT